MLDPKNPEAHSAKAADPTTVCLSSDEEVQLVSPFFFGSETTFKTVRKPQGHPFSQLLKLVEI